MNEQPNLFDVPAVDVSRDITRNRHRGNPQSEAAHESITGSKIAMQQAILRFMAAQGEYGSICNEAEIGLIMLHQTCSARFSELRASGQIVPTGTKRPTSSGRMAAVYRVAAKAAE